MQGKAGKDSQELNEEIVKLLPDPKIGSWILFDTNYYPRLDTLANSVLVASGKKFSELLHVKYSDQMLDQCARQC